MHKKIFSTVALLGLTVLSSFAGDKEQALLQRWEAGGKVYKTDVEAFGIDRCFSVESISDDTFMRMWKKSYKVNCTIHRNELRYVKILHFDTKGEIRIGELVCHRDIASDLISIFRELYEAHYPIERMVLIDNYNANDMTSMAANNTSCFNFRRVAGTKRLSNHSRGRAIDINPLYNPCVRKRRDGTMLIEPAKGKPYADRTKRFSYKIDHNDLAYKLFKKHGFRWGGDWRSVKDYQHFEK